MTAASMTRTPRDPRTILAVAVVALAGALLVALTGPIAALMVGLGIATVAAVVYLPGVVYGAYLLLAFYKGGLQPYSPVDLTIILAGLNIVQIVPLLLDRRRRPISTTGIALFLIMSVVILGGVLWAPDQAMAMDRAIRWWTLVLLPILIGALRTGSDERYLHQFLWSWFLMGAAIVLLGMTTLSNVDRLVVLNTNTIQVARAALVVPILGIAFVMSSRIGVAKASLLVLVPTSLIVAIASGSRGPLLFFAILAIIGMFALAPRLRHVPPWRFLPVAALALASVIGIATVAAELPGAALDRFTLLGDFIQNGLSGDLTTTVGDTSAGNRVVLFEVAAEMFAENPVLGAGTSSFEALSPRSLSPDEVEAWPHNSVLQVAGEFGVIGLSLFLTLVFLALTRRLPYGSAGTALRFLFVFLLLNSMVSGDIFSDRETWGLMMLLLCLGPAETVRTAATAAVVPRSKRGSGALPIPAVVPGAAPATVPAPIPASSTATMPS